ncbi:MAG: AAA family ATPase, partial [Chlamydiales bacterium]|nr:AAA family ATPase [Chlamydiales bacterium]
MMVKQKVIWECSDCGHRQMKWTGSCSICQKWNTFAQGIEIEEKSQRFESAVKTPAQPIRVKEITTSEFRRISTQLPECDRLLGGGIVAGSLTLIGGDPGIGKSTLMLQIAQNLAQQNLTVLYVCGEESVEQTSLRANRLGVDSEKLYLLSETLFSN